jgi:predicted metal-dependent peptidase
MLTKFDIFNKLQSLNEAINEKVDQEALQKVRKSFTQIITNYGFFAELLFNLKIMEADEKSGVETMATDGKSIAYSPKFVHKLTEPEVIFVLIHEVMHNANFHFNRQGARDHQLWNIAADYAINIMIHDMAQDMKGNILSAPKGILLDEKYRGMSAEEIYKLLEEQGKGKGKGKGQGQGQGQDKGQGQGQGQGQGKGNQPGNGGPGELPGDIRAPGSLGGEGIYAGKGQQEGNPELDETDSVEKLEKVWKEIRNNAAVKNAGTGSSTLDRWLRKLNKPKINWRAELKKFVAQVFDELDYAYSNKRFIWQDMHIPGPREADKSSYQNVVIAIDTSGSIGDETLAKFASEMMKLFKTYNILECTVIWCDDDITNVQKFDIADKSFKLDKLRPKGGGGTSFKPPFKWVQNNLIKKGKVPAFMIYFTDAYGDAPSIGEFGIRSYHNRVLWVITENDSATNIKFGKKLFIDKMPG